MVRSNFSPQKGNCSIEEPNAEAEFFSWPETKADAATIEASMASDSIDL